MKKWYMLTLVGSDKPGIVAMVTRVLFENNYNLGETSMLRLGGNFTIMMMLSGASSAEEIRKKISTTCHDLGLHLHIDPIEGRLHQHLIPDVLITVRSADRSGLIAQVTGKLYEAGFDILNLDSDVAGTNERPIYIMRIEGQCKSGVSELQNVLGDLKQTGIDVSIQTIETFVG